MLELIGKEFSLETIKAKEFLDSKGIDYKFIDIDFEEEYLDWIKANKIMGLPILKKDKQFVVGFNKNTILNFIWIASNARWFFT